MAKIQEEVAFDVDVNVEGDASSETSRLDSKITDLNKTFEKLDRVAGTVFRNIGNVSKSQLNAVRKAVDSLQADLVGFNLDIGAGYNDDALGDMKTSAMANLDSLQSKVFDLKNNLSDIDLDMNVDATGVDTKGILSTLSAVSKSASKIMIGASKTVYKSAKTLVVNWGRLLSRTFRGVVSSWGSLISKAFSSTNTGSMLNRLQSLLPYAGLYGIIKLMKEAVTASSSLVEIQNVLDVTFKDLADSVSYFAENYAGVFGLTELNAKQMLGTFGAMLTASKVGSEAAAVMSKNLTALVGDTASLYDMSVDEVFSKFQSGMAGEVVAMRSFGVNATVANLNAYALSNGLNKVYESMTQQEQTILRYNYMLDTLSAAQGDFARTSTSWANQMRILTNGFKYFLSIVGGGVVKVLYPALVVMNRLLNSAITLASAFANAFGFDAVSLETLMGASKGVSDYTSGLEDATSATDDLSDSTAKASSNLLKSDQLSNLSSSSSTKTSGVSTGIGSGLDYNTYIDGLLGDAEKGSDEWADLIVKRVKDIWAEISSPDFTNIKKSFTNLVTEFKKLSGVLSKGIEDIWFSGLKDIYTWLIEEVLPRMLDLSGSFVELLGTIMGILLDLGSDWLSSWFESGNATDSMSSVTTEIDKWIAGVSEFSDSLKDSKTPLKDIADKTIEIRDTFLDSLGGQALVDTFDVLDVKVAEFIENLKDGDVFDTAKDVLAIYLQLSGIVFTNILDLINFITDDKEVRDFAKYLVTEFGDLASFTFDKIEELLDKIANSEDAKDIVENIKTAVENIVTFIVDNADTILKVMKAITDVLVFATEHPGVVATAFGVGKALEIGSGLMTTAALGKMLFGGGGAAAAGTAVGTEAATSALTSIGSVLAKAAPVAAGAAITANLIVNTKANFDHYSSALDTIKNYDADKLLIDSGYLNADSAGDVALNLKAIVDPIEKITKSDYMKKLKKTRLFRIGQTLNSDEVKRYREELENLKSAMETSGLEASPFYSELSNLLAMDDSNFITSANTVFNDMQMMARGLWNSVDSSQDSIIELFDNSALLVDKATGRMYDTVTKTWSDITADSNIAGAQSIAGYITAADGSISTLVTSTGQAYDVIKGTFAPLPAEMASSVTTGVEGMGIAIYANSGLVTRATQVMMDDTERVALLSSSGWTIVGQDMSAKTAAGISASSAVVSGAIVLSSNTAVDTASSDSALNEKTKSLGSWIVSGVAKGVADETSNGGSSLVGAFKGLANACVGWFKEVFEIHSPSALFSRLSVFIPAGIAKGIAGNSDLVTASVSDLKDDMAEVFAGDTLNMSDLLNTNDFKDGLDKSLEDIRSFMSDIPSGSLVAETDFTSSITSKVPTSDLSAWSQSQSATQSGLESALSALGSKFSSAVAQPVQGVVNQFVLTLDGSVLGRFVLDTVSGNAIRVGEF